MLGNDNGSDLEINSCYAIITDSIKGSPFCSSTSYSVSIPFHTVGNVTGPFIAELSNVSGNFDTPLTIGYSTNSPIATSIPQGTPYGNNYRIRVRNSASGLPLYQNTTNLYINTCVNTGLDDLAHGKKPTLYPNPNNGKFCVTIGNEIQEEMNLSIYNALGMQVYQKTVDQNSQDGLIPIDLNQAAAGIYFISIENKGKTTMLKFSVE
ncbi:MAG: T9SS type A sorting domain-containing protein [Bacteroidetes bacterium]|nr:T9SS type A sorting domain-containing protein [Bacteroidota bacterium]